MLRLASCSKCQQHSLHGNIIKNITTNLPTTPGSNCTGSRSQQEKLILIFMQGYHHRKWSVLHLHSLAMLLAMPETKKAETAGDAVGIRRLTSSEPVPNHKCPLRRHVLAQPYSCHCSISGFFKSVVTDTHTPEFGRFNTKLPREQGQSAQPATGAIYTPLIA